MVQCTQLCTHMPFFSSFHDGILSLRDLREVALLDVQVMAEYLVRGVSDDLHDLLLVYPCLDVEVCLIFLPVDLKCRLLFSSLYINSPYSDVDRRMNSN